MQNPRMRRSLAPSPGSAVAVNDLVGQPLKGGADAALGLHRQYLRSVTDPDPESHGSFHGEDDEVIKLGVGDPRCRQWFGVGGRWFLDDDDPVAGLSTGGQHPGNVLLL